MLQDEMEVELGSIYGREQDGQFRDWGSGSMTVAFPRLQLGAAREEQQLLKLSAHISSIPLLHLENLTQPINKGSSVPTVS